MAREIAAWKRKVSNAWDKVRIVSVQRFDMGKEAIMIGHSYNIEAVIDVDTLRSEDIGVEVIMASQIDNNNVHIIAKRELKVERQEGSLVFYKLSLTQPVHLTLRFVSFRKTKNCLTAWTLLWLNGPNRQYLPHS